METVVDLPLENSIERELYRRYRKRRSSGGLFISKDGEGPPELKLESDMGDFSPEGLSFPSESKAGGTPMKERPLSSKSSMVLLKAIKQEEEEVSDSGDFSFGKFASILNSALQGAMSFSELIQQLENSCQDLAERVRDEASERHRVIEDRLLRQKAEMLQNESSTWALLWHLFGKGFDDVDIDDANTSFPTSRQHAHAFTAFDSSAQLCHRIVQWLEGISSKTLDLERKNKGWYAGSYLQKLGVWHQTQRSIRKRAGNGVLVQHLDPDAATREQARIHEEDQKLEEGLLEDIWKLLRAGRVEDARQLCRSAGQPWRAASIGGCGDLGLSSSLANSRNNGNDQELLAIELESGIARQRRLWKWACFCASEKIGDNEDESRLEAAIYASQCGNIKRMLPVCKDWESACWMIVKSWLDVQVDAELSRNNPTIIDRSKLTSGNTDMNDAMVDVNMEAPSGPDSWPQQVAEQQPRDFHAVFQKLHSGDMVHESVGRSCKEQQRQIQMNIILEDIGQLLDLLRTWIVPPNDNFDYSRPHGHPQMVRFGAHLVLVLRHILRDNLKEQFREKLWLTGDLILNTYAIFLFSERMEDLVGIYASQLAPYLCEELYVHMLELRQNESPIVKYKIFRSALEYLPYFAKDPAKGCFSSVLERILNRSREIRPKLHIVKVDDYEQYYRQLNSQKAMAVQWLCFSPPSTILGAEELRRELLLRALQHSNILFREFALTSLWKTPTVPIGASTLLGYLSEPLKNSNDISWSEESPGLQNTLLEFQDWKEYFTCDALYRNWLKFNLENQEIPSHQISPEEKERSAAAAQQALNAAAAFLQSKASSWLAEAELVTEDFDEAEWLELRGVAVLSSSSGYYLTPDPTVCTALTSAFYSSVDEDTIIHRQLSVEISMNTTDENCIDFSLVCKPTKGDGIGSCLGSKGGFLAAIMAASVKGELDSFQAGVTLDILQADAWIVSKENVRIPAFYIVQGLCCRCCLPELILRCMQMRVALVDFQSMWKYEMDFVEMVASGEAEIHKLFSRRQLQEFLLLEREFALGILENIERGDADKE